MRKHTAASTVEHLRVLLGGIASTDFAEIAVKKTDSLVIRSENTKVKYQKEKIEYRILLKLLRHGRLSWIIGNDSSKEALSDLVHRCNDQLKFVPMIDEFSQVPFKIKPDAATSNWSDDSLSIIDNEEKIQRLYNLENKILGHDKRITTTHSYYDQKVEAVSRWTKGSTSQLNRIISKFDIGAEAIAANETGPTNARSNDTQTQYYNLNWKLVATRCAKRCISRIGAEPVSSGSYKILISSRIAQKIICSIFEALRADNVKKDNSFLAGVFGQKIFSNDLTLVDDPFLRSRSGNTLWDDQGTPTQRCSLIKNGKLISFAHNLQTAKAFRVKSTGHAKLSFETGRQHVGAHNLYMEPSRLDQVDLIGQIKGGLYLVETQAPLAFSAKSGDFLLKARGYKVLGNNNFTPIEGAVIKGNFLELLSNICMVGRDLKWGEHYGAPAFVIESLRVEGETSEK